VCAEISFVDEWKTATETSQKFDEFLIDLRKYGFTILTGLITAGSFLGFSFSDKTAADLVNSNILHLGVIYVTMLLVVILFWLDVYYQNLLYGSVLRSRFLEFFRLNFRLSVYISGLYTGSRMDNVLYILYFGFLGGVLLMGLLVVGITEASQNTALDVLGQHGFWILIGTFLLSLAGMGYITKVGIRDRKNKKLTPIMNLFKEYLRSPDRDENKIMELEGKINEHFPFEV
jgi:hypothetical protein